MENEAVKKDEQLLHEANVIINRTALEVGFKPFLNPTILRKADGSVKIGVTCPLCGEKSEFDKPEDLGVISEVTCPKDGTTYNINCCPVCVQSRQTGFERYGRLINVVAGNRLGDIIKRLFDADLHTMKRNMFTNPSETIVFVKDGVRYGAKYGTIMAHLRGNTFEDIDPEYIDEYGRVFAITEDDIYAENRETGEKVNIDSLLVNPEKDGIEFVSEDEVEGNETQSTVENEDTVVENENVVEETVSEEPTTEESASEETISEETTSDETETNDVNESENYNDESNESVETDNSDEITIDDVETKSEESYEPEENEFSEGTVTNPIFVKDESENDTTITNRDESKGVTCHTISDENMSKDDRVADIIIRSPVDENESSKESFNPFEHNPFESLFSNNRKEEENDNNSESSEKDVSKDNTDKDDGVIHIKPVENGEISFPFSKTSGVSHNNESTIISEVKRDSEEKKESVEIKYSMDDDEEDESVIHIKSNTNNNKKDKVKNKSVDEDFGYSNHIDRLKDESKKILERDKKWYDNIVFKQNEGYNDPINEFEDEEDLAKAFAKSKLGEVICEVKARTKCEAELIISEATCELPFVDFDTGVRVICIDCNNIAQMKVLVTGFEKNVPFSYPLPPNTTYRKLYLYSDSLNSESRTRATILNLIKNVNRDRFDPRRVVNLAGNYTLFYTDSIPTIRQYEEANSSYPQGKPCTKTIAIIAMRPVNGGEAAKFTTKDLMSYLAKNYKEDLKSNNLFMVASARYIATFDHRSQIVTYTITEYTELCTTMIKDGFDHIIGAIIKEHRMNNTVKDPNNIGFDFSKYQYNFEFEFDPSSLPSPTLEIWNDNRDFWMTQSSYEDGQGTCYIRVPEYRSSPADGYRNDPRLFLPIPFSKRFKAEIEKNGINVMIDSVRKQFIERIGFVQAFYPRVKKFILNQLTVMKLEFQTSIYGMTKVDLNSFFSGNGIYEDGSYNNILMQRFLMKSIMNSDMDNDTKNLMNAMMINNLMGTNK